jgi:EAL domain-containing protein (putative c-di-GMP-specific phosphodiesterase class I)
MISKSDIKEAIANNELVLYYQPIIELETNEIAGQEALIRWHHPDGLRMPYDFIPECEVDPSIMIEICEFVVRRSLADFKALKGDFMSVNIAPSSLVQDRFWNTLSVHNLLADRPVFFLEITERSLANHKLIAPYFLKTKDKAIGAFIDDFGVEYSGYLQVAQVLDFFPSTDYVKVKLDIDFAKNLASTSYRWFAQSIIKSMRDFPLGKIDVIAEGIEYKWQRDLFLSYGVKYGQGWLWGKANPIA